MPDVLTNPNLIFYPCITDHPGYKIQEPTTFFRHSAKALAVSIGILQAGLIIGQNMDLRLFEVAGSVWKSSERKLDKFKRLKKFIEDNNIGSSSSNNNDNDDGNNNYNIYNVYNNYDTYDDDPFRRELEKILTKYDKIGSYGDLSLVILKDTLDVKWVCKKCKKHAESKDYIL